MSGKKDGNSKILMLKRNEYTHWRVKMMNNWIDSRNPEGKIDNNNIALMATSQRKVKLNRTQSMEL